MRKGQVIKVMRYHLINSQVIKVVLLLIVCSNALYANQNDIPWYCWMPCILTDKVRVINVIEEQNTLLMALYSVGYKNDVAYTMLMNKDTFVVSQEYLNATITKSIQPSNRIDSIFKIKPDSFLLQGMNNRRLIVLPEDYSWNEECYYLLLLFSKNILFYKDCETGDVYIRTDGGILPACQYSPNITQLSGYFSTGLLSSVFSGRASERALTDTIGIYFYYPDHLGSASWITNSQGQAVQYIHYMPFGELWLNQQTSRYDERFKFTGKERDNEKGGIK